MKYRMRLLIATAALSFTLSAYVVTLEASADTAPNYSEPILLKQSQTPFSGPADLAITPDGGYLLVADTGHNEIKVLQPGTLSPLSQFGRDWLVAPSHIEFDANGNLLVADEGFERVTTYLFKGVFRDGSANVKQLDVRRVSAMPPKAPNSATDSDGQRYIINPDQNRIDIFDKNQNRISTYGTTLLKSPGSVETVGRYFWIADTGNNRILLLKAPRPLGK